MIAVILVLGGLFVLSHTAPFPFLLEAFHPRQSVWRVEPVKGAPPSIYLTFDDGPNADWTPAVLDALREHDARATFFLIDSHITSETAPIVRRIAAEGHAIALHSGSRRPMFARPGDFAADLRRRSDRIAAITDAEPCPLFRPHAGWRSGSMYAGLRQAAFTLVGWSWGMWDWDWWRTPKDARVADRLFRKARPGDIVVIHDGHHRNPAADRRHAAGAVRLLVPRLVQLGFSFARLCDG